jgi:hypothetical protein
MEENYMLSPGEVTNGNVDITWSNSFCSTSFEPRYTRTYNQNVIVDGIPSKQKVTRATYTVPILSGILGILMPKKSYKLLPM